MRPCAAVILLLLAPCFAGGQTSVGRSLPGRLIVLYRDGMMAAPPIPPGGSLAASQPLLSVAVFNVPDATAARASFASNPDVVAVAEDRVVFAHALTVRPSPPQVPSASQQQGWAVRAVGGFAASKIDATGQGPWNITQGAGVRIAILDSGVDSTHRVLAANLTTNLSEVDQTVLSSPCDDGSPQDQQGHGTWVASLAAGSRVAEAELAGVAPEATLLNIKVLERMPGIASLADPTGCTAGQGAGLLSWVIQGIQDAIVQKADIISMSFGTLVDLTETDSENLQTIVNHITQAATRAGALLIAAAGNDGLNLTESHYIELPAQSSDVLAILASTNPRCMEQLQAGSRCVAGRVTRPYYSNYGFSSNALAAPGGSYPIEPSATGEPTGNSGWIRGACSLGIPSTLIGPPQDTAHSLACFGLGHVDSIEAMGTSASAALAAGAAALVRAAHPEWSPQSVAQALTASALIEPGLETPQISISLAVLTQTARSSPQQ